MYLDEDAATESWRSRGQGGCWLFVYPFCFSTALFM
jgi:hypothetical protein